MKITTLIVSVALASASLAAASTAYATTYTSVQDIGGETVDLSVTTDGTMGYLRLETSGDAGYYSSYSDVTAFSISGSGPLGGFDATSTQELVSSFIPGFTSYEYIQSGTSGQTTDSFGSTEPYNLVSFVSLSASPTALTVSFAPPYTQIPVPNELPISVPNEFAGSLSISVAAPNGSFDFCAGDFCGTSAVGESLSYTPDGGTASTLTLSYPTDSTSITLASAVSAAPEPSSWLLMIAGVGLVGAVFRRRKMGGGCQKGRFAGPQRMKLKPGGDFGLA